MHTLLIKRSFNSKNSIISKWIHETWVNGKKIGGLVSHCIERNFSEK